MSVPSRKAPNLDSVTTINRDGSHFILHPADVSGRFTFWRKVVAVVLLIIYVGLPWIRINGAPAVFLDVANRNFHLFGITLAPQDLWVLFFAITGMGFMLFFVTALLGRLWCGWACPYTIFLEHIFRRIERWIDGDAPSRRRLEAAPWTANKVFRRVLKHSLYLISALLIANVFLSYFVSLENLYTYIGESPLENLRPFTIVAFLTASFYFCFSHFREQFCIMVCPYGRLQSALTDDDTVIIGYDELRGEPRGKVSDPNRGACIDCNRCVAVCPTGIDIRNGLQLECIGCAACIDACDDIMRKINQPTGLIRYDSHNGLTRQPRRLARPRIFAYAALGFLGLIALTATTLTKARPYTVSSSRMMGPPFFVDPAHVRNNYQLRLLNKRNQPAIFSISLENPPPGYSLSGADQAFTVQAHDEVARPAIVLVDQAAYTGPTELILTFHGQPGNVKIRHKVRFVGPNPSTLRRSSTED